METREKKNKKRADYFLTQEALEIVDKKARDWGISKSNVIELALREFNKREYFV